MLFHLIISHGPQDCPGRHPTEPPSLVAPSDRRDELGRELGVKQHFVLWGASCMLWAQPEHLAFAVLEADDLESVSQYVAALVPTSWSVNAVPVWNLPAQLRLIRQVRLAPSLQFGEALTRAEPEADSESPKDAATPPARATDSAEQAAANDPSQINTQPALERAATGTITRLLRELEAPPHNPGRLTADSTVVPPAKESDTTSQFPTQFISPQAAEQEATRRARLQSIAGPSKGRTYLVPLQGATIGRFPDSPVSIPDGRLSREHAQIQFRDGEYWLRDLGSKNGTALNGSPMSDEQRLQSGDVIELGDSRLVVTIEPEPPADASVTPD